MKREQNTDQILETFGINRQTLQSWIKKGCPCTKAGKGKPSKFDEGEIASWMKANGVTGAVGRPGGAISEQLKAAQLRKENAMADYHEIRVAKERGLLIDRAEQERLNIKKFNTIRSMFAAVPAATAPVLQGMTVPEAEAELERRITDVLTELSKQ